MKWWYRAKNLSLLNNYVQLIGVFDLPSCFPSPFFSSYEFSSPFFSSYATGYLPKLGFCYYSWFISVNTKLNSSSSDVCDVRSVGSSLDSSITSIIRSNFIYKSPFRGIRLSITKDLHILCARYNSWHIVIRLCSSTR